MRSPISFRYSFGRSAGLVNFAHPISVFITAQKIVFKVVYRISCLYYGEKIKRKGKKIIFSHRYIKIRVDKSQFLNIAKKEKTA